MCALLSEIDLHPVRVSVGEVVYPPAGRLGPRWQHDVELVLLHAGSARIAVDDDSPFVLLPGYVALLLPGHRELFEFDPREETHHSWVQLGLGDPLPAEVALAPRVLPASAALTELVQGAVSATRTSLATGEQLAAALAAAAIWRYVGEAGSRTEGQPDPVGLARGYLNLHLADADVSLERVATAAHVTPAHLVRRFRAELGTTPVAYLWQRRVEAGVDLLTSTGLPVGEVARRVGFRSVYHFSRRVKQATGLPPTELRRRGWSQTAGSAEYAISVPVGHPGARIKWLKQDGTEGSRGIRLSPPITRR
jgi:AraC family transcriptional regulator of arabinose operon